MKRGGGPDPSAQRLGYPVLFARASLKRRRPEGDTHRQLPLSRAFCAGLIEAFWPGSPGVSASELSRAFCAGLIEAGPTRAAARASDPGYPVLFARASLKPGVRRGCSAAVFALSRAFCAGLIEAACASANAFTCQFCYPVLFARASLKLPVSIAISSISSRLSRAFCAGLIEARDAWPLRSRSRKRYPVLFARASLKLFQRLRCSLVVGSYPVLFARASLKPILNSRFSCRRTLVIPCFLRGPH